MKAIDRLYQYLKIKGIKPTNFEKEIGLSNGYFSVQKKRNADIGESVLKKITEYCQDLNPVWLLTGTGDMLIDETVKKLTQYTKTAKNEPDLDSKVFTWMVFSMYEKQKGLDFSFDSFPRLGNIFNLASTYMEVLQESLETELYVDLVKDLQRQMEFNEDGDVIIPDSLMAVIDKYAEIYKRLEIIGIDIMKILQSSSAQKGVFSQLKNKLSK